MSRYPLPLLVALTGALLSCAPASDDAARTERVLLVTTTTVEDSGLLDVLTRAYHASQDRYRLATTAVGSGAALEMGRRGDAHVLLTHDPAGEARFMAAGHGVEQGPVMRNEFVIAGPESDPAGVAGAPDLARALARIAGSGALFISRGDDSGTHRRELDLWRRAGVPADRRTAGWYVEGGLGMAEALRMADQRVAYVLTDSGTLRHLSEGLGLVPLVRGEPSEENVYQYTIPVRPAPGEGARDFVDWLMGPGQAVIARYGADGFDAPLFLPADSGTG